MAGAPSQPTFTVLDRSDCLPQLARLISIRVDVRCSRPRLFDFWQPISHYILAPILTKLEHSRLRRIVLAARAVLPADGVPSTATQY